MHLTLGLIFLFICCQNCFAESQLSERIFQNLRRKEIKSGFKERVSKKSRFFRSGVIGEGKKYLTKNQLNMIKKEFSSTLNRLGYKYILN